jgi:hypothetical protein
MSFEKLKFFREGKTEKWPFDDLQDYCYHFSMVIILKIDVFIASSMSQCIQGHWLEFRSQYTTTNHQVEGKNGNPILHWKKFVCSRVPHALRFGIGDEFASPINNEGSDHFDHEECFPLPGRYQSVRTGIWRNINLETKSFKLATTDWGKSIVSSDN